MPQNNLFEVAETFEVEEKYHYREWAVKDATGKKLAAVYETAEKGVRCLTCDRRAVGLGNACPHVQAVRKMIDAG